MSESDTAGVVTEELQQEVAPPESQEDQSPQGAESEAERRKRNDVEYNWAEARRKMQELERRSVEQQELIASLQKKKEVDQDSDLNGLQDDDILTVAQARKLAVKLARQTAEEVVKQREASTLEERLTLKHPDYAQVVTAENIEALKQSEPELALSLYHIPDPYQQAVAAYKMLKKFGKTASAPSLEARKLAENSKKPVSVNAAVKSSAIGNAHHFENGLTSELKAQLWKEMEEARKRG